MTLDEIHRQRLEAEARVAAAGGPGVAKLLGDSALMEAAHRNGLAAAAEALRQFRRETSFE